MNRKVLAREVFPTSLPAASAIQFSRVAAPCLLSVLLAAGISAAQVVTVDTRTGTVTNNSTGHSGTIDRRYQQIQPTHVPLPNAALDPKTRLELIRLLQSEQGFAMRPFPRGHKGLTLVANGELKPAGEDYLAMIVAEGTASKPGDRLVLSDLKIDHNRIVFLLNGGPEGKHRFLRHVSLGGDVGTGPIVPDDAEPNGSRLTLEFEKQIPALTGQQVKALLAPLISFDVKTPVQAFTDTLPDKLKEAVLNHRVMVGMSTEMLLYAKGQPETKYHEIDGNMPFDEWVYGKPPKDVEFVRINGNRVIRLEIARMGKTPEVFTKDEVEGMMRTDGTPLTLAADKQKDEIKLGDVERNPDTQAPAPPPTLGSPNDKSGDKPADSTQRVDVMKPVQFPKQKPASPSPQPGANPDGEPESQTPANATPPDAGASQPPPASTPTPQPPPASQQPPPASQPN